MVNVQTVIILEGLAVEGDGHGLAGLPVLFGGLVILIRIDGDIVGRDERRTVRRSGGGGGAALNLLQADRFGRSRHDRLGHHDRILRQGAGDGQLDPVVGGDRLILLQRDDLLGGGLLGRHGGGGGLLGRHGGGGGLLGRHGGGRGLLRRHGGRGGLLRRHGGGRGLLGRGDLDQRQAGHAVQIKLRLHDSADRGHSLEQRTERAVHDRVDSKRLTLRQLGQFVELEAEGQFGMLVREADVPRVQNRQVGRSDRGGRSKLRLVLVRLVAAADRDGGITATVARFIAALVAVALGIRLFGNDVGIDELVGIVELIGIDELVGIVKLVGVNNVVFVIVCVDVKVVVIRHALVERVRRNGLFLFLLELRRDRRSHRIRREQADAHHERQEEAEKPFPHVVLHRMYLLLL